MHANTISIFNQGKEKFGGGLIITAARAIQKRKKKFRKKDETGISNEWVRSE